MAICIARFDQFHSVKIGLPRLAVACFAWPQIGTMSYPRRHWKPAGTLKSAHPRALCRSLLVQHRTLRSRSRSKHVYHRCDAMTLDAESITVLLQQSREGSGEAMDRLLPLVYARLRRLANHLMRAERPGHTLSATALVHEAYLRMVSGDADWQDRIHFYSVAAKVMRHVLVDHARSQGRQKRGSRGEKVTLDEALMVGPEISLDLLSLDMAMQKLAAVDARKSQIVELMFFGGLTARDVMLALDISQATLFRDLKLAKAFLYRELGAAGER